MSKNVPGTQWDVQRWEYDGDRNIYHHVETHMWNQPYSKCMGLKKKLETQKWAPKTFFKITVNGKNNQEAVVLNAPRNEIHPQQSNLHSSPARRKHV